MLPTTAVSAREGGQGRTVALIAVATSTALVGEDPGDVMAVKILPQVSNVNCAVWVPRVTPPPPLAARLASAMDTRTQRRESATL